MPDSRCMLVFPNLAGDLTLSGGTWGKPITNLQDRYLSRYAETSTTSATVTGTFATAQKISMIALVGMNCSINATYSITVSNGSTTVYSKSNTSVWPSFYNSVDMDWDAVHFWTGAPNTYDLAGSNTWPLLVLPPNDVLCKTFTLTVSDSGNPSGKLRFGRLFLGKGFQFSQNLGKGGLDWNTDTTITKAKGGAKHFDKRPAYRSFRADYDNIPEPEIASRIGLWARQAGLDQEVFVLPDPTDINTPFEFSFMGNFRRLSGLELAIYGLGNTGFEIEEIVG